MLNKLVFLFALLSPAAYAKSPGADCDTLVRGAVAKTIDDGFKLAETKPTPNGELAAFVNQETLTARLFYATKAPDEVTTLTSKGWDVVGECRASSGDMFTLLRRDVKMDPAPKADL